MFLEQVIESTIRQVFIDQGVTAIDTGDSTSTEVTIRTFWKEDYSAESTPENKAKFLPPMVELMAAPSSRPVLEDPEREVKLTVGVVTYFDDDEDRRVLAAIYSKVRYLIETTAFDFGSNVVFGGIEIQAVGDIDVVDKNNIAAFECIVKLCAGAFE